MSRAGNFALHLRHVPSKDNVADAPSRTLSDIDCSLSEEAWVRVQATFGPHTFDLMSLDSNCCKDKSGNLLPHQSPWPTPNRTLQVLTSSHNLCPSGIMFTSFLLLPWWALCSGFSLIITGVSPLPLSFFVYTPIVIGGQFSRPSQ